MKSISAFSNILIHKNPVDMRKSINGLSVIVSEELKLDLKTSTLFVFTNRRRTHMKILYFDKSGFALWLKRLESSKFSWPKNIDKDVVELKNKIDLLSGKVDNYEEEIKRLRHIIKLFKEEKFGSKSESYQEDLQLIFNEIEVEAQGEQLPLEQEQITYVRKKGRQKKKPFPEALLREDVIIDIPEADKVCPHDGTRLKEIGEDIVEKLKTVPAQSTIIVERKKKYACPCCELHLVQAKSNSILPKTIATPEILSFLMFSKFFQGLPLYRLEELYKLQGIYLTRGTMARWLIQVSEKLIPVWNILEERVLDSDYMAIDVTKVQVLKEKNRKPQDGSFMWVRGSPEQGIVLFDYNISGGGKIAKSLIGDFRGGVQADAHKGY